MEFLSSIKARIPDWAKDIRLNLDGTIARSTLPAHDATGVALAAAYAARSPDLIAAFKGGLSETDAIGVLTAAALMGMNNTYYPFVEMAADDATHGGVDKNRFELFALAASIVGKCHFCVGSHYENLKKAGYTTEQLRDVGRIASVVNAAAQVLLADAASLPD
jgi:alkyl hydroperoxide reductase subunit D